MLFSYYSNVPVTSLTLITSDIKGNNCLNFQYFRASLLALTITITVKSSNIRRVIVMNECVPNKLAGVVHGDEHLSFRFARFDSYLLLHPTRLCPSTAGSSPPRRTAIFVYAVHHVSMLHPSTVPGRLAISYVAFP